VAGHCLPAVKVTSPSAKWRDWPPLKEHSGSPRPPASTLPVQKMLWVGSFMPYATAARIEDRQTPLPLGRRGQAGSTPRPKGRGTLSSRREPQNLEHRTAQQSIRHFQRSTGFSKVRPSQRPGRAPLPLGFNPPTALLTSRITSQNLNVMLSHSHLQACLAPCITCCCTLFAAGRLAHSAALQQQNQISLHFLSRGSFIPLSLSCGLHSQSNNHVCRREHGGVLGPLMADSSTAEISANDAERVLTRATMLARRSGALLQTAPEM